MRKRLYDLPCPIANALDIIGDRWTMLILRDLFMGRRRYRDLQEALAGIPPTLLTERLRLLENEGILLRQIYSDSPLRADYELSPKGRELADVMMALARWGERNYPSEDGAHYHAIHQSCGGTVQPDGICSDCGEVVPAHELALAVGRIATTYEGADEDEDE
jgi:DNA-binding HxlR family transcriptional regulator